MKMPRTSARSIYRDRDESRSLNNRNIDDSVETSRSRSTNSDTNIRRRNNGDENSRPIRRFSSNYSSTILSDAGILRRFNFKSIEKLKQNSFCTIYRGVRQTMSDDRRLLPSTKDAANQQIVLRILTADCGNNRYSRFLERDQSASKKLVHESLLPLLQSQKLDFGYIFRVVHITEYMSGGSLLDLLLENDQPLNEQTARGYFRQFGDALRYIHGEGFAHRNLKCEKILLTADRSACKLTDFALTRSCFPYSFASHPLLLLPPLTVTNDSGTKDKSEFYCHCPVAAYMAPESLLQQAGGIVQRPYNTFRADVYSAGVVLYVMTHRKLPFREWLLRLWIEAQESRRYRIATNVSPQLTDLLHAQLSPQPNVRPSMEEVLEFAWFKDHH